MADSPSFRAAKQKLENQMTDKQQRLMFILTGNCRYESSSAKEEAIELLENEIEDRNNAIVRLEAQSCCDSCKTQADVRHKCRIRVTKYNEKLPTMKLMMEKVLVTVECVDCWRKYDLQQRAERTVATKDEIFSAIEMLSSSQQWRDLENIAYRRAQRFPANFGKTGEELFQEALSQTWDGRKKWNIAAVDFFGHMLFAIKNIAFGWEQEFYRRKPLLEVDNVIYNAEGDEISVFENVAASDPPTDQCLSTKDEVERLFGKFGDDRPATAILQAQREGVSSACEIMQDQKLTRRQYEAAWRRIRSQKSVLIIEEYDRLLELFVRLLRAMDFAVVTASTASEGLRLYRKYGPFDVVIVSCLRDLNGVELALNIRKRNPLQNMIITTIYSSEEDVVRPSELAHVPVLLKPYKTELRAALDSFANSVKDEPVNRCRQKRRSGTTVKMRIPLRIGSKPKLPKRDGILNATPSS